MKNIISCHLSYLLNKVTIITLIVVLIMSGLGFYYAGEYLTNSHSLSLANDYYYYHSFFVIKLLGIFVFVFMVGNSFLLKNDHYSHLLLTANISRTYYFGSKILSIGLLIAGFIWIVFVLFVIVGFFRSHNFIYDNNLFWRFVNLCLFFWYYSLIGLIFIQLTNNIYTIIIPIAIVNLITILSELQITSVLVNFFFISFDNQGKYLVYGIEHGLVMTSLLLLLNLIIYLKKDL